MFILVELLGVSPLLSLKKHAAAAPGDGRMILFWDGATIPTDWTCISCTPGDDFYQRFPRGEETYGGVGGSVDHTHTATSSITATTATTTSEAGAGATVRDNSHGHSLSTTIGTASNLPAYRNLKIIRYDFSNEPPTIPSGAIGLFDNASLPSGWSAYSAQNGSYVRGENTIATGGSNSSSHALSFVIGTATGTTYGPRTNGSTALSAIAGHTHTASGNSSTVNTEPPYIETVFGQSTSAAAPPNGLLAMWDDDQPSNWTKQSNSGGPFNQRFIKAAAAFGATGGSTSHSHANTSVVTSGPTGGSLTTRNGSTGSSATHTHTISVTNYSTANHIPPYRNAIIAKRVPQSAFEQSAYRFYKNADATTPGSPLAANNTSTNAPRQGKPFRLRMLVHVSDADLLSGNKNFKLQVAERSVTCDTSFSGETYADVSSGSGAIRYYNNSSPIDGSSISTTGNDPSHGGDTIRAQTYEEENTFTNTNAIAVGEDGMWDFSLVDHSAAASTGYCFRIVTSDNSLFTTYSVVPEIITDNGSGHMIVFWDGASIPSGWSCVSCDPSDDFYQKFFRGNTTYGATGGSETHSHSISGATITGVNGLTVESDSGGTVSSGGHTHPAFTPTIQPASILPPFRQLQVIRADTSGVPVTLPAGVIALFDNTVPTGWTRYSAQDGNYIRGENTVGTTGGSLTHTHTVTGTLGAASGTDQARTNGSQVGSALDGHTHNLNAPSAPASNEPPFISTIMGQLNADASVPLNIITLWDNPIPGSWTHISSSGQPFHQTFVKPQATYGTTGGSATHTHADSVVVTDAPSGGAGNLRSGTANAGDAHTHDVTVTGFSSESSLPPYIDVIVAKLGVLNTPPNNPTSLDQKRTSDDSVVAVGDYANSGQIKFTADATDTDNPDDLQLCVEVVPVAISFTNTATQCGSAAVYSGSAVEVALVVSGLADGESYHWQAYIKDGGGGISSWVSFGGNAESAADFIIDASAPSGAIYDGTTASLDIDYNDGSLDVLDANWDITDSGSGVELFEYSIGTTIGGTDIVNWTANAMTTTATESSLTLSTSQVYYFNVRSTDFAGNQSNISSDGQTVAPTLSFSVDSGNVTFDNLTISNNYTDTEDTSFTTSTNARNGYEIRAYVTGLLEEVTGSTINMFNGGTYATPDAWGLSDEGYGYTSDDTLVQGVNMFNAGTCAGGGVGPCFAPFATSAPGDIVADNQSNVEGSPITDETFTITQRVTTTEQQKPGNYQTVLILNATAIY